MAHLGASLLAGAPPRLRRLLWYQSCGAVAGAAETGSRSFARPSRPEGGASHSCRPSMRHVHLVAIFLAALAAPTAEAKREDHPSKLLDLLAGIDTVPGAAALRAAAPDTQPALLRVALDTDLRIYVRRRAVSLLGAFPDDTSEAFLTVLAAGQPEERLRWVAIYTYGRVFAPLAPKRVRAFLDVSLASPNASDREAAVRALRWFPGKDADELLGRAEAREQDQAVRAAIARVRKQRAQE